MFLQQVFSLFSGLYPSGLSTLVKVTFILFCVFTIVGVIMSFVYIINELRRLFHA